MTDQDRPEEPKRPRITRGPPAIPPPDTSVPPPPEWAGGPAPAEGAPPAGDADDEITLQPRESDIPIPLPMGREPPRQRPPTPPPAPGPPLTKHAPFQIGGAIARTVQVWFGRFLLYNGLTAAILSPALLLDVVAFFSDGDNTAIERAAEWAHTGLGLAVAAVVVVAVAWQLEGLRASVGECAGRAVENIAPVIGVAILEWLALAAGTVVMIGCAGTAGFMALIPAIVLLLWVYLAFFVALPAVVVEQHGPIDAIRRSMELMKGHRLAVFLVLVVGLLPFGVGMFVASGVAESNPGAGFWLGTAVNVLLVSFHAVMTGVVYHDLRVAVDGVSSRALAEQLGAIFD